LGSNSFPNLNAGNVPLSSFLTGPRVWLATLAASNHGSMNSKPSRWNSSSDSPFPGRCVTCHSAGLGAQPSRWATISVNRLRKIWKSVPMSGDNPVARGRTWNFSHTLYTSILPPHTPAKNSTWPRWTCACSLIRFKKIRENWSAVILDNTIFKPMQHSFAQSSIALTDLSSESPPKHPELSLHNDSSWTVAVSIFSTVQINAIGRTEPTASEAWFAMNFQTRSGAPENWRNIAARPRIQSF
jgi:hypothetical protein